MVSDVFSFVSVRPRQLLGSPSRQGATVEVPAHRRSSVSGNSQAVKSPAGGPEGGEGLADPAVPGFVEIVGQDSLLVLQLLQEEGADGGEQRS